MSAQITRDQNLPAPCKRCGGVIFQYVDFCPHCGAEHPLDTNAQMRPKATVRVLGPTASAPPVPTAATVPDAGAPASDRTSAKPDYQHNYELQQGPPFWHASRWSFVKGFVLVWFVIALAYVGYLVLGQSRKQESAIDNQGTHTSGGSVSLYSPEQQTNAMPPAADTQLQSATPKPRPTPQFKDVPDSLRAARASLAENNLSDAKAANDAALALDADNEDARTIQRDIAAREQRRDNALQSADQCAKQRAWACVQQQASEALAIDSSSQHAQSLMEHAIVATAWAPLSPPNSTTTAPQAPRPAVSKVRPAPAPHPPPSATNAAKAAKAQNATNALQAPDALNAASAAKATNAANAANAASATKAPNATTTPQAPQVPNAMNSTNAPNPTSAANATKAPNVVNATSATNTTNAADATNVTNAVNAASATNPANTAKAVNAANVTSATNSANAPIAPSATNATNAAKAPNAPIAASTTNAANTSNTPAEENPAPPSSANGRATAASASEPATVNAASAARPASTDNSVDAQERAIRQFGWKHAVTPPDATH